MAGQEEEAQEDQEEIFQELAANKDFASAAAAIELHGAKGKGAGRRQNQGAMPDDGGKGD